MRQRQLNCLRANVRCKIRERPGANAMNTSTHQSQRAAEATAPVLVTGSDKAFGVVFCAVFVVIALYPLVAGAPVRLWALGLAALFLIAAFFLPRVLSPLNRAWTRIGMAMHRVVSPVALFVVFCLAVLPTGLLMRLLGKDLLRLRLEPESDTYWIERSPPGRSDQQMKKQF